jgi:hemerythrin-like domain-containing protein
MAVEIGAKPDSGFDHPIGMLKDCHRRIERFLGVLCLVVESSRGISLTVAESEAVQGALQYFRTGVRRHAEDEEKSLSPRLRSSDGNSLEEICRLEGDHREANELHGSVERLYSTWIASGELGLQGRLQLRAETRRLKQLYSDHILLEETIVFTRAAQLQDSHAIAAMGTEFRLRRK